MTDSALIDRVVATVYSAGVSKAEVDLEWPTCHKNKCQASHGSPEMAFSYMAHSIAEALKLELMARATTQPDVAEDGDSPECVAVYTLAALLTRYRPEITSTYVRAARLIIDAYPGMVSALNDPATA